MLHYGVTIFLSAFLLFEVQLILAKRILPWFGGAPAVWTTCMLFFQLLLLAGYAYAHGLAAHLSMTAQRRLHLALIAVSLGLLALLWSAWGNPILPDADWKPQDSALPVWRILVLLGASVGLPFFLLAATNPLLQAWFSRAHPRHAAVAVVRALQLGLLARSARLSVPARMAVAAAVTGLVLDGRLPVVHRWHRRDRAHTGNIRHRVHERARGPVAATAARALHAVAGARRLRVGAAARRHQPDDAGNRRHPVSVGAAAQSLPAFFLFSVSKATVGTGAAPTPWRYSPRSPASAWRCTWAWTCPSGCRSPLTLSCCSSPA